MLEKKSVKEGLKMIYNARFLIERIKEIRTVKFIVFKFINRLVIVSFYANPLSY